MVPNERLFQGKQRELLTTDTEMAMPFPLQTNDKGSCFEGNGTPLHLAWKIPWMEELGRLQSMGSLRVGHD